MAQPILRACAARPREKSTTLPLRRRSKKSVKPCRAADASLVLGGGRAKLRTSGSATASGSHTREVSMLKIVAIAAIIVVASVVLVLAYAATRPDAFQVARSIRIKAPPEKIFPLIDNLRSFNRWNPFLKNDPATRLTYSGPESSTGAAHEWDGNSRVGQGRLEITDSVPSSRIVMKLDMIKPIEGHNRVEFTLEPTGGTTDVTWAMSGRAAYIAKVMGLVLSMDKMVGGEFERGLADLKVLAEH
jgi:uncharacterized protein YndB with AHSA1/START domain